MTRSVSKSTNATLATSARLRGRHARVLERHEELRWRSRGHRRATARASSPSDLHWIQGPLVVWRKGLARRRWCRTITCMRVSLSLSRSLSSMCVVCCSIAHGAPACVCLVFVHGVSASPVWMEMPIRHPWPRGRRRAGAGARGPDRARAQSGENIRSAARARVQRHVVVAVAQTPRSSGTTLA